MEMPDGSPLTLDGAAAVIGAFYQHYKKPTGGPDNPSIGEGAVDFALAGLYAEILLMPKAEAVALLEECSRMCHEALETPGCEKLRFRLEETSAREEPRVE